MIEEKAIILGGMAKTTPSSSEAARALGRLGAGKPKTLTPEQRKERGNNARKATAARMAKAKEGRGHLQNH